jgi:hypothetical protein
MHEAKTLLKLSGCTRPWQNGQALVFDALKQGVKYRFRIRIGMRNLFQD